MHETTCLICAVVNIQMHSRSEEKEEFLDWTNTVQIYKYACLSMHVLVITPDPLSLEGIWLAHNFNTASTDLRYDAET